MVLASGLASAAEAAGYIGAAVAGGAYLPQIRHLVKERCSAGLSRSAFGLWLLSSVLVTTHAVVSGATVFVALGTIQLAAIAVILYYSTRYAESYCASHTPAPDGAADRESAACGPAEADVLRFSTPHRPVASRSHLRIVDPPESPGRIPASDRQTEHRGKAHQKEDGG